ncbi:MAG: CheY-like chemotaxis protein [Sulfurimonas sp.]|jgi:CheY-like chemotaxis protein|uniref:response regulator n=1 Tax=Sulfurimonas sp. TaxID=2022749 RepID=UPI0039E38306
MKNEIQDLETLQYLKTLTLLCVEDNKTTQLLYSSIFEDLVKEIICAHDGEEGYRKFMDEDIDIIISDYSMPKLDGLGMIKKIRMQDTNIPIILVSTIENIAIMLEAIKLDINGFAKKPIEYEEVVKQLQNAAKLRIANNVLRKQKAKEVYTSYQEDLGLSKELNILRNDFYYQMLDSQAIYLLDFLYQPLDVMSGDAYCARRIDEHSTFYLMVDGMGKGLSASLTAMIMTSFVNHMIDKMIVLDSFDLAILVHETMEYIKPVLLDEEAISIDYIHINDEEKILYYAKFAMPVLLMENNDSELVRVKSNNSPLSKWQDTFNIDSYDISEIKKFLIYSDGIVENETIHDSKPYSDFIENDFLHSFTREDLKNSFFEKITTQEDDISLIYIHKLIPSSIDVANKSFSSSMNALEVAGLWYENIWKSISQNQSLNDNAGLVFTELLMNAYEHGNLGIDAGFKHRLLEDDIYFETLKEKEQICNKKINVKINKVKHYSSWYIVTQITDEGKGFDTQILSEIFRNSATFNGRGVFVSRKNSLGIYYNSKGNSVVFLNKIEQS